MGLAGTDGGDDTLAHAGDDGFFPGAAYQTLDVGAHGDAGLGPQLDAVLGDGGDHGGLDDLGGNAHLHGLQHVAARQINGGSLFKGHFDIGALGGDERVDDAIHVAAGQIVGLQLGKGHVQTGLAGLDEGIDQQLGLDAAQAHTGQRTDAHVYPGGQRGDPQAHGHKTQENQYHDQRQHDDQHDPQRGQAVAAVAIRVDKSPEKIHVLSSLR